MLVRFSLTLLALTGSALAQDKPAEPPAQVKAEMTTETFEMFKLAPGKTEDFIRSLAEWDKVNVAGGGQPTRLYLHAGGEGWDVLLYKPARVKPTPAQEAAMAAKIKELGLPTGAIYFLEIRQKMADHIHFEASGPTTAAAWVTGLDRQRAEVKAGK
ncbi:hypothetical protein [Sphingomonas sp. LT1P40]|uniref:hypothetical protein n=1 Tax=Alteristakelama amylovorans TaxID=3096166 RepID=UPI002FC88E37